MTALEKGAEAPGFLMSTRTVDTNNSNHCLSKPRFGEGLIVPFQGKTAFYDIEVYDSGARGFTEQREYSDLVRETINTYLAVYPYRDRDISIQRMTKALSHPRSKLLIARESEDTLGFGLFPKFSFLGEPVIYSSRAFLKEGEGLGTFVLDAGIQLHQLDAYRGKNRMPRWGALMTQNPYSVKTLRKLQELGRIEEIFPFDVRYDDKTNPDAPLAKNLMMAAHNHVNLNSAVLYTGTGVSKREVSEVGENEVKKPSKENDSVAWEIFHQMVQDPSPEEPYNLGMNLHNGDVDYVAFKIRRLISVVDSEASEELHVA